MIDPMKILNPLHLRLARTVLDLNKSELAKRIGTSVSTLDAVEGVAVRKVSLDKRVEVRGLIDALLLDNGWYITDSGGIDRIKEKSGDHE